MGGLGTLRWLGQSGFEIKADDKVVLIDPFLSGNPKAPIGPEEIEEADLVFITHDHEDHWGDSVDICNRTGATFVGIFELANYANERGVEDVIGINIGATLDVEGIKVSMVRAFHSCRRGSPCGFVLNFNEKRIYHSGDTSLFEDMKLISELSKPEIACLPIGGYYTMGAREAVEAVKLIKPEAVIPMHYLTFPVLAESADEFVNLLKEKTPEIEPIILDPGEVYEF